MLLGGSLMTHWGHSMSLIYRVTLNPLLRLRLRLKLRLGGRLS